MTSKKEKSMHKPARTQKRFGLLLLLAAAIALLTLSGTQAAAQEPETSYSVLYNFCSQPNCADGAGPNAGVIRDEAGNLYGTTSSGGNVSSLFCAPTGGCGVVFKLDRKGKETVLYSFCSQTNCADGADPSGLIRDEAGNLYGTTNRGGTFTSIDPQVPVCAAAGCGVVFKLDRDGEYTVLYTFTGGADGGLPIGSLIRDEAGNLYGTTDRGGNLSSKCLFFFPGEGCGVVFKLDREGKETVLYTFSGGADGAHPAGSLIRDEAGNLYGTTTYGGIEEPGDQTFGPFGTGVVFKLDREGKETVLHAFTGGTDGAFPNAPLVRDAAGNLYGTTNQGANFTCIPGCGVVFKIDRLGEETTLYTFTGGADGASPFGGLTLGQEGRWDDDRWDRNLYGTTLHGGPPFFPGCFDPDGCGVVFKVDRSGKETVLHAFNGTDGSNPSGVLLKHHDSLYGTTSMRGPSFTGNIFKITLDDDRRHHCEDAEETEECESE